MRSSTSALIVSGDAMKRSSVCATDALGGVLDRHDAVLGAAALDLVEDGVDGSERAAGCARSRTGSAAACCEYVPAGPR